MFLCVIHSSQHTEFLEEGYGLLCTWVWFLGGCVETGLPRNSSSFFFLSLMAYWISRPSGHFLFEDLQFPWTLSMEREKYLCICWILEPHISTSATFLYQNFEVKNWGDNSLHLNYLLQVFILWEIFTVKIHNSTLILKFMSTPWCNTGSVHLRVLKLLTLIFLRSSMSEASFESLGKVQCASLK